MDADERRALIEQLRRDADEGRANIAERERRLADDPAASMDRLMAEARTEPVRRPPMRKSGDDLLMYRTVEDALVVDAPQPEPAVSDGYPPFDELLRGIAEATMMLIQRERDAFERKIADLKIENAKLEGKLTAMLELLGKSDAVSENVVELRRKRGDVA